MNKINIHATCVDYQGCGVLITGASGSGKSDLALRLIMDKGATLVADDRTDVFARDEELYASCPDTISGLIEVRGIGICKFPLCPETSVKLVVELVSDSRKTERLPQEVTDCICGLNIKKIILCGFEASAPDKVILACRLFK